MEPEKKKLRRKRFSKDKKGSNKKKGEGQGEGLGPVGDAGCAGEKTRGAVGDGSAMVMALLRRDVESAEGSKDDCCKIDKREGEKDDLF